MPFRLPRPLSVLSVLAGVLAAGLGLAVAGCGHVTPLGPVPPTDVHLGSPIVLQALRSQAPTPGGCPAGWVELALAGSGSTCYRKVGTPVTLTTGALSAMFSRVGGGSAGGGPAGFTVDVAAGDVAAVTAVIRQAYDARGALGISVDGRTWSAPMVLQPFPGRQLQIVFPGRNEAARLYRILGPPS
jgi:hypothetical protein